MEHLYKAYTREVNNQTIYFVKKFTVFTEFEGHPQTLERLGMHTNFVKACHLANIQDEPILSDLYKQLNIKPEETRVISMNKSKPANNLWVRNAHQVLHKFRLAGF